MATLLHSPLLEKRRVTVAEYEAMPEDGHQYQLIHGQLIMSPSPSWDHQGMADEITGQFRDFLRGKSIGKYRSASIDVFLGDHVLQPDVLFVSPEHAARISPQGVRGAPDLVVEVLSPGTTRRDRKVKREIYQEFGVREMWFVSPKTRQIEVHRQAGGVYAAPFTISSGETLTSPLLPGFTLDVAAVFDAD